jgi:hypothetical protein
MKLPRVVVVGLIALLSFVPRIHAYGTITGYCQ